MDCKTKAIRIVGSTALLNPSLKVITSAALYQTQKPDGHKVKYVLASSQTYLHCKICWILVYTNPAISLYIFYEY